MSGQPEVRITWKHTPDPARAARLARLLIDLAAQPLPAQTVNESPTRQPGAAEPAANHKEATNDGNHNGN